MMRLDWLNFTFDKEREGMSTNGARPRSAELTTESARSRMDPIVFLSLFGSADFSELVFFGLAICFVCRFLWIHDQHVFTEVLHLGFDFLPFNQLRVGNSGLAFGDIDQPAVQVLARP